LEAQRDQAREIADDVVARISDLERQLEEAKTAVSWLRGIAPPCPADNFGQGRWLEAMDAANKFLQRKE
jgi:hypothetical protein